MLWSPCFTDAFCMLLICKTSAEQGFPAQAAGDHCGTSWQVDSLFYAPFILLLIPTQTRRGVGSFTWEKYNKDNLWSLYEGCENSLKTLNRAWAGHFYIWLSLIHESFILLLSCYLKKKKIKASNFGCYIALKLWRLKSRLKLEAKPLHL